MKEVYYEIEHKETKQDGVASLVNEQLILVCYGRDDGSDDKTISHKEFFEEFNIIGFIYMEV